MPFPSVEDVHGPESAPRRDLVLGLQLPDAPVEAVGLVPRLPVILPAHGGLPPPRPGGVVLELQDDRICNKQMVSRIADAEKKILLLLLVLG